MKWFEERGRGWESDSGIEASGFEGFFGGEFDYRRGLEGVWGVGGTRVFGFTGFSRDIFCVGVTLGWFFSRFFRFFFCRFWSL